MFFMERYTSAINDDNLRGIIRTTDGFYPVRITIACKLIDDTYIRFYIREALSEDWMQDLYGTKHKMPPTFNPHTEAFGYFDLYISDESKMLGVLEELMRICVLKEIRCVEIHSDPAECVSTLLSYNGKSFDRIIRSTTVHPDSGSTYHRIRYIMKLERRYKTKG